MESKNKLGVRVVTNILKYPDTIGSCIYHTSRYYYSSRDRIIGFNRYCISLDKYEKE